MLKLLVPVDGSESSTHAVDHVAHRMPGLKGGSEIHLISVQAPVPGGSVVASIVGQDQLRKYHQEEAMAVLKPAMDVLTAAGFPVVHHIVVGDAASLIVQFAKERGCNYIVMGTRGLGASGSLVMGSVAMKVVNLTEIPVLLIK